MREWFIGLTCLLAGSSAAADEARRPAPVALTVVTLDELRQGQQAYGRSHLASLGDARFGVFEWAEPAVSFDRLASCVRRRMGSGLDYCIRFYLTRADAGPVPAVVVVFDDSPQTESRSDRGNLRATCFGRGVVAIDPQGQDIRMSPLAARLHGVRELEDDRNALAKCIRAAASEAFTGLRQPDPRGQ